MEISTTLVVIGTFIIAGTVKGVIGLGLPTVSLALLTVAIDLPSAMALLLAPSLVTNIWQALSGRATIDLLKRIWPFLLSAALTVGVGTMALTRVNLSILSTLLGVLIVVYASINLGGLRFTIKLRQEAWVGLLAGAINGTLTGMTGSFVVPGVMYLQAINLSREALIQAMGMLFTVSTLALGMALGHNDFLNVDHGVLSLSALLPAIGGMAMGQLIRKRLSALWFRNVFFISLLALGLYIMGIHM